LWWNLHFWSSITKLFCTDFKTKISSSTSTNYGVESSIKYCRPKLFLVDSKLEFVVNWNFQLLHQKGVFQWNSNFLISLYQNLMDQKFFSIR
jgi:hypothetical protein